MLRDDAVSILKQRMGNNNDISLDALIVTEMQFVQETILEQGAELPWFLYGTSTVTETVANPTAPAGFLTESEAVPLQIYNGTRYVKFPKGDPVDLEGYDFNGLKAYPVAYSSADLGGADEFMIRVWGWDGTTDYSVKWNGYYAADELSTNIENKWLKFAADLMIAETGAIIAAQYNAFVQFAELFAQQRATAQRRIQAKNAMWEEQNIERIVGGG